SQMDLSIDEPDEDDLYQIGTIAEIKQMLKLPNGTIRVLVEGLKRAKITRFYDRDDFFQVEAKPIEEVEDKTDTKVIALMRSLLEQFEQYVHISKKVSKETLQSVQDIQEPS